MKVNKIRIIAAMLIVLTLVLMNTGMVFAADEDITEAENEAVLDASAEPEEQTVAPQEDIAEETTEFEANPEPDTEDAETELSEETPEKMEDDDLNPVDTEDPTDPEDPESESDPEVAETHAAAFAAVLSRLLDGNGYAEIEDLQIPVSEIDNLCDFLAESGIDDIAVLYSDDDGVCEIAMLDAGNDSDEEDEDTVDTEPSRNIANDSSDEYWDAETLSEPVASIAAEDSEDTPDGTCEQAETVPADEGSEDTPDEPIGSVFGLAFILVGASKVLAHLI